MNADSQETFSQLAAEYVLGTLRGPARRRFEALLAQDEDARAEVDFWTQRLGEFGQALDPVAPPAALRADVLAEAARGAQPTRRFGAPRRRRRRVGLWAAMAAGLAALAVAFMLGQRNPVLIDEPHGAELARDSAAPPSAKGAPEEEKVPVFLAELQMPSSQMRWLVSLSPDHRELSVTAGDDFFQVGRYRFHLWGVTQDNDVHSLGVLPFQRDHTAVFSVPDGLRGREELRFVLSLESSGTQPSDRPQGQVLWESRARDMI